MRRYLVVFERARRNWSAYCPDLPGCVAVGRTKAETERLMLEAIELHIDGLRRQRMRPPRPSATAEVFVMA